MDAKLEALLRQQDGVVSRRQLMELEVTDNDIERMVRRRECARVFPGVFVEHTGPLTWRQRAWAAVLCAWPAALANGSALHAHGLRGHPPADGDPVVVCVDRSRSVTPRPGVVVTYLTGLDAKCQMLLSPPRERVEHAVLGEASGRKREDSALGVVADACQQGRTTVSRLVEALGERPRLKHHRFLLEVLADIQTGAYSVLEHRYLVRVERRHGLPQGERQRRVRHGRRTAFRDVDYLDHHTVVELDGRIGHEDTEDAWADLDRDLASLVAGDLTLRAGWKQVLDECRLAAIVAQILVRRGWLGRPRACGPGCAVASIDWSEFPAPGAGDRRQTDVA
jgi:hypothetical protein